MAALDGLRGIAVLLVVLMHLRLPGITYGGAVGVTAFFVLSGYLITSILLAEREATRAVDLRSFWLRRAARLLPALALLLVATWTVLTLAGVSAWSTIRAAAFYYANVRMAHGGQMAPIAHVWSLAVEEQFYLLWPLTLLLAVTFAGRGAVTRVAVTGAVVSILIRVLEFLAGGHQLAYFSTEGNGFALLLGCALAATQITVSRRTAWVALAVLLLLATQPFVEAVRFGWREDLVSIPAAFTTALIVAGIQAGFAPLEWSPLATLGRVSYGVYLWHATVFYFLPDLELKALVGLPLTVLMTCLSWRYVEQPIMRLVARARDPEPHQRSDIGRRRTILRSHQQTY